MKQEIKTNVNDGQYLGWKNTIDNFEERKEVKEKTEEELKENGQSQNDSRTPKENGITKIPRKEESITENSNKSLTKGGDY